MQLNRSRRCCCCCRRVQSATALPLPTASAAGRSPRIGGGANDRSGARGGRSSSDRTADCGTAAPPTAPLGGPAADPVMYGIITDSQIREQHSRAIQSGCLVLSRFSISWDTAASSFLPTTQAHSPPPTHYVHPVLSTVWTLHVYLLIAILQTKL
jgi:hypothetical protein